MSTTPSVTEPDRERSLGEYCIEEGCFGWDLKIAEAYQTYSAELLRLSLLAMTGLSLVWLKLYLPGKDDLHRNLEVNHVVVWMMLSFAGFAIAAACALMHRYASADSLAYQLTMLRRRLRNRQAKPGKPSDMELAIRERKIRDKLFDRSGLLLKCSAAALFFGVVVFGIAMYGVMSSPVVAALNIGSK